MVKRRLSGGYYGNAMETVGESEKSYTSGKIDDENRVSEDSSIPARKRKCLSLNSSPRNAFGVPMQVVPLSNLSPIWKKKLVQKLRSELKRVQILREKVELQRKPSISSSGPADQVKALRKIQKARGCNRGSSGKFKSEPRTSSPSSANEKKLPRSDALPLLAKPDTCEDMETTRPMKPSKKRKFASLPREPEVTPPAKKVMSKQEKHNLGRELESLMGEMPVHIIDFLKKSSLNCGESGEDDIEIDNLSDDTLFTLRKLFEDFLQEKQKKKSKVEACEIEVLNVSVPSNSSLQALKGDDQADEEVDIGGNESPLSSYPPVEIEKDTTDRMNEHSSPGSSDTDSSSSSDDVKASPAIVAKVPENMGSGAQLDEKTRAADAFERNQSVSGSDKLEDDSQQKLRSFHSDSHQDGGCDTTERQISRDKVDRAALLKNRYADTILKAREKTLKQGDPEKLHREREKLEMEQRKVKARHEAEAKAAEDARKRAEAEAAAEARRKRELEREAARQALLQMEKTAEINDNSVFLEDL